MKLSYSAVEALTAKIIDAAKAGHVTTAAATGAITHIVAAVAKGEKAEVQAWVADPAVFDRWLASARQ